MKVEIKITSSDVHEWSSPEVSIIILSVVSPDGISEFQDFETVLNSLRRHPHEWSLIFVEKRQSGLHKTYLVKSITSSYELFYIYDTESVFVADQFQTCVVQIPPQDRVPNDETTIDHFLFRSVSGSNTYLPQVRRVRHGELILFREGTLVPETKRIQKLESYPQRGKTHEYLDRIEGALNQVLSAYKSEALMFSGGVDSTLLAHYMPEAKLVNNRISSPEFDRDHEYATSASALLNRPLEVMEFDEDNYLARLEDVIDRIGMPPQHSQTVLHSEAFLCPHLTGFVVGQFADGIFGIASAGKCRYGPLVAKFPFYQIFKTLALLPINRIKRISIVSHQFRANPRSAGSFTNMFACPLKLEIAKQLFSCEDIESRFASRFDYTLSLLEKGQFSLVKANQVELGHLVVFFTADTVSIWRQLAQSYDKKLYSPFVAPLLMGVAMSVPRDERYCNHGETKYILKELLRRHLPSYPVEKPTLGAAMPICRLVQEGCLKVVFEKYNLPEFVSPEFFEKVIVSDYAAAWHLVSFMIWADRVKNINTIPLLSLERNLEF